MLSRRNQRRLRRYMIIVITALVANLTLPTQTRAVSAAETETQPIISALSIPETISPAPAIDLPQLPTVPDKPRPEAKQHFYYRSSAYSSTPDQTDGDPFTTASGAKVHPGTVATNCLPFGTKIRIPEYFGDTIFIVEDRMHPRWGCEKIDLWMTSRQEAMQWGVRKVHIEII